MDSRSSYSPVRPLVIALCVILILSLVLTCVRRRRILAFQQQQLAQQQNQTTELGDVAYMYQYPPPAGTPYQPGGGGQGLYAPPPGVPGMSQPIAGSYYTPGGVDGQQQQQPFPQAHFAYPPMPLPANGATSSTSTTTTSMYVAPQDGSANLTNADISEGVPAIPPPPYTATVPK